MALFQIAEPNQSIAPHELHWAIGIDLGTTHSLVAVKKNGSTSCLKDEKGRCLLPSVVHYGEQTTLVGQDAQEWFVQSPQNTIISAKRFMGRHLSEIENAAQLPYQFDESENVIHIQTPQGKKTPIEIAAEILKTLKERAQNNLGAPILGAVITVPAYFDDAQRQATKDAARLAGLNVLRLINEPTAAALAYGLNNRSEGVFAVYDLGGGTFDISILRLSQGLFEVLATGGNTALGGDDFDWALFHYLESQCPHFPKEDRHARRELLKIAKLAKEKLSFEKKITLTVEWNQFQQTLTLERSLLKQLFQPLIEQTLRTVQKTLRDAHLNKTEMDGVVLVGGATRMPAVQEAVEDFFKQKPLTNLNPDEVVALGAAEQAAVLAGNEKNDWLLLDVTPLSLGIETYGGLVEKIIPRNSTIPCARAQDFTTFKDGQTAMAIHVVQGERELVEDCRSLARFQLHHIPPMNAGVARIRVTFQVDADGLLSVLAREETTGQEAKVEVHPAYGLKEEEIVQMLHNSTTHAKDDAQQRALREAKVEAERLIEATTSALKSDADLLSQAECTTIEQAVGQLKDCLKQNQRQPILSAMNELTLLTENFASLRMNKSIAQALAGKKIDDFSL